MHGTVCNIVLCWLLVHPAVLCCTYTPGQQLDSTTRAAHTEDAAFQ